MITLMNAAPDTGNQGVTALCYSAINGLSRRGMGPFAVSDHGIGRRRAVWEIEETHGAVELFGLSNTRRFWRGDCLRVACWMARLGGGTSASARTVVDTRAVLDVSGGDSFTDLYGPKRFQTMVLTKRLALDLGKPLILLPQTLGPFRDPRNQEIAFELLRRATGVFVRDARSFATLRRALGARFDPARHCKGPDMAVLLPKQAPRGLPRQIREWLSTERTCPVAGLNISGLLYLDRDASAAGISLADDHRAQIHAAARAALHSDPKMRLILVPHVRRAQDHPESDFKAAKLLEEELIRAYPGRIDVLPQDYSATELKWIISRLDWFCGARMHATIAAFSSGVPTLGLGYSDKAAGVFAECGIAAEVADLRLTRADGIGRAVARSLATRAEMRDRLAAILPKVQARAEAQMDAIAALLAQEVSR